MIHRTGRRLRVVLMTSAAFYAAFIARSLFEVNGALYATLFDDAMISMRYARNLAGGQGLVWNPGGPPVQGFTNPAWTLIMAGVHAAGAPPRLASLVVMIIGAALLLTLATETFRLGRLITEDDDIAVTGAAFIATSYAVVFWTLTIFDKAKGWLTPSFHQRFRELMLHAAAREDLLCPIYCLMPDHLHLVWMGLRLDSDQINGMVFLRTYLEPELSPAKFQPQPQDEVLREEQRKRNAFAKVCFYIAANPVRAELIGEKEVWPFTGCVIPGYPKLNPLKEDYWPKFWRVFGKLRQPDAGDIKRPPIG